ncbi:hypothetical protein KR100_04370 [Synechococcus sp. KORDI-100]|nr:hypothetical protein KR100_04370 [Synechococcus sp. KORDI-100]
MHKVLALFSIQVSQNRTVEICKVPFLITQKQLSTTRIMLCSITIVELPGRDERIIKELLLIMQRQLKSILVTLMLTATVAVPSMN